MELKTLLYEKEGNIATITFNRPRQYNAINTEMSEELILLLDKIDGDGDIRCVILTGGEKAFAAGGDIGYMSRLSHLEVNAFGKSIHKMMNRIESLSKPVIAAISGLALGGGCEITLCCDIRLAAENASFGLPEVNLALLPGGGGTQRLTRTVGIGWARQMIMTGEPVDANTALKIGLVTKVTPKEELMESARKLAACLAEKAPITLRQIKSCLNHSIYADLRSGLEYEQQAFQFLFATEDETEGVTAFVEKRKAEFKGK
jgi:enoyl-CoA hydratase